MVKMHSPLNSAFLVTEILHRTYALCSQAHLTVASVVHGTQWARRSYTSAGCSCYWAGRCAGEGTAGRTL
jgi:hypothetical protein